MKHLLAEIKKINSKILWNEPQQPHPTKPLNNIY